MNNKIISDKEHAQIISNQISEHHQKRQQQQDERRAWMSDVLQQQREEREQKERGNIGNFIEEKYRRPKDF